MLAKSQPVKVVGKRKENIDQEESIWKKFIHVLMMIVQANIHLKLLLIAIQEKNIDQSIRKIDFSLLFLILENNYFFLKNFFNNFFTFFYYIF